MKQLVKFGFYSLFLAALFFTVQACRKGEVKSGGFPETSISFDEINLTGENRLNSSVRLSWYGSDADGYIEGYELSLDQQAWNFTTATDSVFLFDIPAGQDSADIDFYVRAIDNDGNTDPTPAYLRVPLINTPPQATLLDERGPRDSAFIAATFFWSAQDPDGNNTLQDVQMKINDGTWVSIDMNQNLITFLPDTNVNTGLATSQIYYGTSTAPANITIDGMRINDTNRIYIRAFDIAQAESTIDTSELFYFRGKTSGTSTLWVSGHDAFVTQEYRSYLQNSGISYDLLNLGAQQGSNIPKYFDPTVQLIFAQYKNAFLNLPTTSFTNTVTGAEETLLTFLAPVIQRFTDRGGKYFLTTAFTKNEDISDIATVYPVDELVESTVPGSQARVSPDSALVPLIAGSYPEMQPTNVEFGIVPIISTADAIDFYRAELTKLRNWNGQTDVIAAIRRPNNQLTEVFFALELHKYDSDPTKVEQLIGDIFNNEF